MSGIQSISIENFRGFYAKQTIELSAPSGSYGSGLTVFVGPNNSGKTTVIDALKLLARTNVTIDIEHRHENERMVISSADASGRTKSITNPDGGAVTDNLGDKLAMPNTNTLRFVPSRRAWNAYSSMQPMNTQNYWANIYQRDQNQIDDLFVSRIAEIAVNEKEKFHEILENAFPRIQNWNVERSRGQLFIQYETPTGARHSADLFGDGMASVFRLALSIYDCKEGQCLVIDEPELSLHPQAQKRLASYLSRIASNRQVIVTTHSPYMINLGDLANGGKVYRLAQNQDGVRVYSISTDTLAILIRLLTDWQKPNLLDLSRAKSSLRRR
ncbi:MAG: AAA family ATPase [Geminicoccaceae bacterium]